jgi:hypothetical protein
MMDRVGFAGVAQILKTQLSLQIESRQPFETAWGHCRSEVLRFSTSRREPSTTLVRFPHLSRYQLFSRAQCLPNVDACLQVAVAAEVRREKSI